MLAVLSRCQAACGPPLRSSLVPELAAAISAACNGGITPIGSRGLAAAAAAPPGAAEQASPPQWQQRFDGITPGSVLRFELPHSPAQLSIKVGEHEAIELSGSSELAGRRADHDGHPGSSLGALSRQLPRTREMSASCVWVAEATCLHPVCRRALPPAVTVSAAAPGSGPAPLRVQARGPSRFLSVEATTGGGSLEVEVVQEGSLRLRSGGGSIVVPKVGGRLGAAQPLTAVHVCAMPAAAGLHTPGLRAAPAAAKCATPLKQLHPSPALQVKAFDAHLDSAGGPITGAVTGVDVRLRSGGGAVRLKSLVS